MLATALQPHLAARGAVHVADRGVLLPAHFGDAAAEHAALGASAGLVDLGYRTVVRATGADRVGFLQGMLTNDVARLAPGTGCPALLLTIQGRIVADVRVAAPADAILLDVDVRVRDGFVEALGKLIIADDVELGAESLTLIGLEGPQAAALLEAPALAPFALAGITVGGVPVRAVHASEVGGAGFVLHAPAARAGAVWDTLAAAGAHPCGMEALEARRIEAHLPRIGLDMDLSTLALELPVGDAVSTTKGCYLGQEVVARGSARGHVNRRLVALAVEGARPPAGAPLVRDGKEVGRLTSVASPCAGPGAVAALGFVRREYWDTGTELRVVHGHAVAIARITASPLAPAVR